MANVLGVYNPIFYANEALIQLEKALGMAGRVHRGYDLERRSFRKGEYTSIRRPSTFTEQDAPSTAQDVETGTVQIQLAFWKEVKFKLTDKELAFTGERIINDHIRPAAYALANGIDQKLAALYADIPWFTDLAAPSVVADITGMQQTLFDNEVPLSDMNNTHIMIDGKRQNEWLQLPAFSQHQGAGVTGVETQRRGTLGTKYGFEVFANQNTPSHVPGTLDDVSIALVGAHAKGLETIVLDEISLSGTLVKGDTLVIAGNTQRYAVTALATAAGNAITVNITPALVQAYLDDAVVAIELDAHVANLAFHSNAFALTTAPLSEMGNELGARIATAADPVTGLSLRSRIYYVGDDSEVHVALDALYGVKTLDPNLATRGRGA